MFDVVVFGSCMIDFIRWVLLILKINLILKNILQVMLIEAQSLVRQSIPKVLKSVLVARAAIRR